MISYFKTIGLGFSLLLLLLLTACNLSSCGAKEPLDTPVLTDTPAEEVVLFEPDPGTIVRWWDGSDIIYIPAGEFVMGDDALVGSDHAPAHPVALEGFWIQQTEVSNRMYAQCVVSGACQVAAPGVSDDDPEKANHPVVGVTWENARSYCSWIGGGLPSEAQWEWAARGETGYPYPWGTEGPNCGRLNFRDCNTPTFTAPVNSYPLGLSPFFLADTSGNVYEWVQDWYAEGYFSESPSANPPGPESGELRVLRSSSYYSPSDAVQVFQRSALDPDESRKDLGFRCMIHPQSISEPTLPACSLLSYVPISKVPMQPVHQQILPPALALTTYCNLDNQNNEYGTALIVFEQATDVANVKISSPQGTLICTQDQNLPMVFTCVGTSLAPGNTVTISACYPPPPVQPMPNPTCPVFYHFNGATNLCEYGVPIPVVCAAPNVVIFGYGCLPAPQNGDCPVGSFVGTFNNKPVCIPASGPTCQGQNCPAVCPEGMTFNDADICCDYPDDVVPVCPVGYAFDENFKGCVPTQQIQANPCTSITTPIDSCAPQPEPGCWVTTYFPSSAPVTKCTSPCPPNASPGGVCYP